MQTFGSQQLHTMFSATASAVRAVAGRLSYEASRTAKIGSYARREQESAFQSNYVAGKITQLFKQLRASQICEAIAERELARKAERALKRELGNPELGQRELNPDFHRELSSSAQPIFRTGSENSPCCGTRRENLGSDLCHRLTCAP